MREDKSPYPCGAQGGSSLIIGPAAGASSAADGQSLCLVPCVAGGLHGASIRYCCALWRGRAAAAFRTHSTPRVPRRETSRPKGPASPPPRGPAAEGFAAAMDDAGALMVVKGSDVETALSGGIEAAVRAAQAADVVVLALGETSRMTGEAQSRTEIDVPAAQRALAEAVRATGRPVSVLARWMSGSPSASISLAIVSSSLARSAAGRTR